MKKFLILFLLFIPVLVNCLEYPNVDSKVVEIYDLNDKKILYEKGSNNKISIASLTKIATTITAIENIENLDEKVTITNYMLNTVDIEASVAGLKAGDRLTYRDLLYASMLPSGADATNSLAILISGSIDEFVKKMNELKDKLNLDNTHFVNVTGLDIKSHYSTKDDVRKLLEYALKNKLFREIFTTKEYKMSNGKIVKSTLYKYGSNTKAIDKILGSKTGYTGDAGYCLSSLVNINGHEILIIVLNASRNNNSFYNIIDTLDLINFMENNYEYRTLIENNILIKSLPINLSKQESYEIYSDRQITKYLPSDYNIDSFKYEYIGLEELSYKNKVEEKIGTINYYYENELLYTQDVILNEKIDMDFFKIVKKHYILVISIFAIIILTITLLIIKRKRVNK